MRCSSVLCAFCGILVGCSNLAVREILKGREEVVVVRLVSPPDKTEYLLHDELLCNMDGTPLANVLCDGLLVEAVYTDNSTRHVAPRIAHAAELQLVPGINVIPVQTDENAEYESDITFAIFCYSEYDMLAPLSLHYGDAHDERAALARAFQSVLGVSYELARTETSYTQWKTVYDWATSNERGDARYTFYNAGNEGSEGMSGAPDAGSGEPVTNVSLRDVRIWCNAKSEMLGLQPVYRVGGGVARSAIASSGIDNATIDVSANGFRLPTATEWQYAARGGLAAFYADKTHDMPYSNFAASTLDFPWKHKYAGTDDEGTLSEYAVYDSECTAACGMLLPNSIHLYDMTGNVAEWTDTRSVDKYRVCGGSYQDSADDCKIDAEQNLPAATATSFIGFRVCRSILVQ